MTGTDIEIGGFHFHAKFPHQWDSNVPRGLLDAPCRMSVLLANEENDTFGAESMGQIATKLVIYFYQIGLFKPKTWKTQNLFSSTTKRKWESQKPK